MVQLFERLYQTHWKSSFIRKEPTPQTPRFVSALHFGGLGQAADNTADIITPRRLDIEINSPRTIEQSVNSHKSKKQSEQSNAEEKTDTMLTKRFTPTKALVFENSTYDATPSSSAPHLFSDSKRREYVEFDATRYIQGRTLQTQTKGGKATCTSSMDQLPGHNSMFHAQDLSKENAETASKAGNSNGSGPGIQSGTTKSTMLRRKHFKQVERQ